MEEQAEAVDSEEEKYEESQDNAAEAESESEEWFPISLPQAPLFAFELHLTQSH